MGARSDKKALTEEVETREQAELRAAEKVARLERRALRIKERENARAKNCYQRIWEQFATDRKDSVSRAYANLLENLTTFAAYLVPIMMTAKEHMALIADAESHIKGEGHASSEDPRTLVAAWLRGDLELSRIPLEAKVQIDGVQ